MASQQRYSAAALRACLDILLSAEQSMKSTGAADDVILDEAVAKIFIAGRENL